MRPSLLIFYLFLLMSLLSCSSGKHLFILSGQSNMVGMNPKESFVPTIEKKFGAEKVIVVKHAKGGQPVRRWYKGWKEFNLDLPNSQPDLFDSLLTRVQHAIKDEKIKTVSFIWMQGERDAREELGTYYEKSLLGLYEQLSTSLNRQDINFVIGRLSDFDLLNKKYPHWTKIRELHVKIAESNTRFDWVDTDDLNDGLNRREKPIKDDLHMSKEGYRVMGERFAEKAIALIEKN